MYHGPRKTLVARAGIAQKRDFKFVEYCCSPTSALGNETTSRGIPTFRITKEDAPFDTVEGNAKIDDELSDGPCALWSSLPCTDWSCWQFYNMQKLGPRFRKLLYERRILSRARLNHFLERADANLAQGGLVAF
jgi:hypothetical protein